LFKQYYSMAKPGIIYGNIITAAAGFLLASKGHIDFSHLIEVLIGISLVIGSACVFNNYIDRDIDEVMARTKNRSLVKGTVRKRNAILFAITMGLIGFLVLYLFTNSLVIWIGLIAFIDYVAIYGYFKRRSVHGTLVGSISGAAPIVAGYCAVSGRIDAASIILFLIMAVWQMPHFYAIAMFRFDDYKAAKLPVLPVKSGMKNTKFQILLYIGAFVIATTMLRIYGYTGDFYLLTVLLVGFYWFFMAVKGKRARDDTVWARKMFFFSLIVVMVFSVLISMNHWLS